MKTFLLRCAQVNDNYSYVYNDFEISCIIPSEVLGLACLQLTVMLTQFSILFQR